MSKSWIKTLATKTTKGNALQRILCILMTNNPVKIQVENIDECFMLKIITSLAIFRWIKVSLIHECQYLLY